MVEEVNVRDRKSGSMKCYVAGRTGATLDVYRLFLSDSEFSLTILESRPVTGPSRRHMTFGWVSVVDRPVQLSLNHYTVQVPRSYLIKLLISDRP